MLSTYIQSLIRTGSALLVGWLLSLPLTHPILVAVGQTDISTPDREKWAAGIATVLTAAYYALVRALEPKFPALTWLLGSPSQPVAYAPSPAAATPAVDDPAHPGLIDPDVPLNSGTSSALPVPGGQNPDQPDPFMQGGHETPDASAQPIAFTKEN